MLPSLRMESWYKSIYVIGFPIIFPIFPIELPIFPIELAKKQFFQKGSESTFK